MTRRVRKMIKQSTVCKHQESVLARAPISKLLQESTIAKSLVKDSFLGKMRSLSPGGSRGSKCNDLLVASAPLDGKLDSELAADVVDLF